VDPNIKLANTDNSEFNRLLTEYLAKFEHRITLRLGQPYNKDFMEFHTWCVERLGTKHKDWFLYPLEKGEYLLFVRDTKWIMFLMLEHVDKIV
jgi:hypothetical protein